MGHAHLLFLPVDETEEVLKAARDHTSQLVREGVRFIRRTWGGREGEREGEKEEGKERGRERGREGGREGGRKEGRREGGKEERRKREPEGDEYEFYLL